MNRLNMLTTYLVAPLFRRCLALNPDSYFCDTVLVPIAIDNPQQPSQKSNPQIGSGFVDRKSIDNSAPNTSPTTLGAVTSRLGGMNG